MRKQPTFALIAVLLATFFLMAPGLALAVGLGPIQSNTHIGQNLEARVPILATNPNVLQGLTVGLAKPEAYRRAGIHESDFLFDLRFQVKQGANGPYVLITSTRPVRLPFLNILVHARWSSGAVTRQYTLLLNPPVFASARPEQAQSPAPVAAPTTPRRQTPIARPKPSPTRLEPPPKPGYVVRNPVPAQPSRPGVYGPIQRGATLWGIAENVRSGASVNQMMIAIYRANPQAFSGNINRLKAGATLRIPSRAEVARISRIAANAEVAKQVASWKAAKAGANSAVAKTAAPVHTPAKQAGGSNKGSAKVAGNASGKLSAKQSGEVVLTAPKITQLVAAGAAVASGKPAGGTGSASGAATVAGALVAAAGARSGGETKSAGAARGAGVPAASAGGPAKVHNAGLANLAAAGQAAARKPKPAENRSRPAGQKEHAAGASDKTGRARTATGAGGGGLSATVWDWLTSPKGWIVIALIVLFLILIVFLLVRRNRRHERNLMALAASASAPDAPVREREEPAQDSSAVVVEDEPAVAALAAEPIGSDHSGAEAWEESGTEFLEEAARQDARVEADLFASRGDYAGAVTVLNEALEAAPERNDLRLRLLELRFATDDGPAFRETAEALRHRVPETGSEWRSVAVMGRELLPDDPLFAGNEAGEQTLESALAGDRETNREAEPTDFDFELDRLDEEESADAREPDEFERTLGELSTMIETYMPESGEGPVELHLPPEESDSSAPAVNKDSTLAEPADAFAEESLEKTQGFARLELAQAYLDMDDRESARVTLESLVAESDGSERERAQEMLAVMNAEPGDEFSAETVAALDPDEDAAPFEADESGTAMDLARAYLELGDRESARDILEEILDDGSESQRDKARELLETLS